MTAGAAFHGVVVRVLDRGLHGSERLLAPAGGGQVWRNSGDLVCVFLSFSSSSLVAAVLRRDRISIVEKLWFADLRKQREADAGVYMEGISWSRGNGNNRIQEYFAWTERTRIRIKLLTRG
jgi:hypothetical protein